MDRRPGWGYCLPVTSRIQRSRHQPGPTGSRACYSMAIDSGPGQLYFHVKFQVLPRSWDRGELPTQT